MAVTIGTTSKPYFGVIDFIRAVLIVLVILVHIVHFGNLHPDIKLSVLSFLMPAFLVITGYLVNVEKPLRAFALYLLRIFLPYAIMVTGYCVLSLYLPVRDGIAELSVPVLARVLLVTSIGPYWFLHTMMVCGVAYYTTFRLFAGYDVTARYAVLALLLLLVARFTPILSIEAAAYYFIGVGIRHYVGDFSRCYRSSLWPVLPFAAIMANRDFRPWGALSVLAAVCCFVSVMAWVYARIGSERVLQTVHYVGRNTLPIYIFHPIFTMGSKYLVPLFSFDPTGVLHALTTILLCLVGSLAVGWVLDYTHLSYVFGKKQIMR